MMSSGLADLESLKREYDQKGYVVVDGIFDAEEDFRDLIEDYSEVLDGIARRWHAQGGISSTFFAPNLP